MYNQIKKNSFIEIYFIYLYQLVTYFEYMFFSIL